MGNVGSRWDNWVAGANARPADWAEREDRGFRRFARQPAALLVFFMLQGTFVAYWAIFGTAEAAGAAIFDMLVVALVVTVLWFANRSRYTDERSMRDSAAVRSQD